MERCCKTCRYWTAPAFARKHGQCKNDFAHYGAKVPFAGGYAMIDTFGKPDTPPTYLCDQWDSRPSPAAEKV